MAKGIGTSFGGKSSPNADKSFAAKSMPRGKAQSTRQARGGLRKVKGLPLRQGAKALPSIPGMSGGQMAGGGSIGSGAGGVSGI